MGVMPTLKATWKKATLCAVWTIWLLFNLQINGYLVIYKREVGEIIKLGSFFPKNELLGLTCARAGVAAPPSHWRGLLVGEEGCQPREEQVGLGRWLQGARTSLRG